MNPFLLGAVYRTDLGAFQVTYAGHPLYLFDPGPDSFFGANFYETVQPLPPEHTAWFLLSPSGTPATGPATLETESPQAGTTYSSTELATEMLPACRRRGRLRLHLQPVTRTSAPATTHARGTSSRSRRSGRRRSGAGVNPSAVGTIWRADGTRQVTYDGHPLYIYSQEQPLAGPSGLSRPARAATATGSAPSAGLSAWSTPDRPRSSRSGTATARAPAAAVAATSVSRRGRCRRPGHRGSAPVP